MNIKKRGQDRTINNKISPKTVNNFTFLTKIIENEQNELNMRREKDLI